MSAVSLVTLSFSFIKESVFAYYYGASDITDAYTIAIQIPVILFSLISTAIGNVILPYYTVELNNKGPRFAEQYISNIMSIITFFSVFIVVILELFPEWVISFFAPGFSQDSLETSSKIFRLVLPTVVFTELMNINNSVMNVHRSFVLPSLGSLIMNLVFVLSIVFLVFDYGIYAAALGVVLGTVCSFVYSLLLRRKYIKYKFIFNPFDRKIIFSLKKSIPIFLGIGASEINKMVDTWVSSFLSFGAISMLTYGSKLTSAVSTLLINSITTVVYPELADSVANKDEDRIAKSVIFAIKIVFLIMIPVTFGGAVLSEDIVTIVYKRGAFGSNEVNGTSPIFAAYLVCLLFVALRQISSRAFYAYGDTNTPMKNSFIGVLINIILDLTIVDYFGAVGLAMATTAANVVISILILKQLKRKNQLITYSGLLPALGKILLASAIMSFGIYSIKSLFYSQIIFIKHTFFSISAFFLIELLLGVIIYVYILCKLKLSEVNLLIFRLFRRNI